MDRVIGHSLLLICEVFRVYFRHLLCTAPGCNVPFELIWHFHTKKTINLPAV